MLELARTFPSTKPEEKEIDHSRWFDLFEAITFPLQKHAGRPGDRLPEGIIAKHAVGSLLVREHAVGLGR